MSSAVSTQTMRQTRTLNNGRSKAASKKLGRTASSQGIRLAAMLLIIAFMYVLLAAYTAKLQTYNNDLQKQNDYLEAEIDSINNEITNETTLGKIEKIASSKYGMIYPNAKNYVTIKDTKSGEGSLADAIKDEAYN